MIHVLDACAMLAYLRGAPGAQVVGALFQRGAHCNAHSLNLCEVYYHVLREGDERQAAAAVSDLFADGVVERADMDRPFWQRVARLKSRGRISLADCHALALAQTLGGEVLTSDHHEFDPLVPLNLCPIRFIR